MKTKLATLALALIPLFLVNVAMADPVTSNGPVTVIYPQSGTEDIKFKIGGNGCGFIHGNHYFRLLKGHKTFDESYALLLASAYTGKSISVRYDDAACSSGIGTTNIFYVLQNF